MAGIQVIDRQEDPTVKAITGFGDSVANAIRAKQALKLKSIELGIHSKNTENEANRLEMEQVQKALDFFAKGKEDGYPPEMLMETAKAAFGDKVSVRALQLMGETVSKATGSVKDRLAEAQIPNVQSQTQMNQLLLNKLGGGGGAQSPANIGVGADGSPEASVPAGNPRAQAVGGGYQPSQITYSGGRLGATFTDPEQELANKRAGVMATKEAEQEVSLKPIQDAYRGYLAQMDRAFNEIGGPNETSALAARFKGESSKLYSELGNLPEVQAAKQLKQAMALTFGSYVNRGRPTDKDAIAAERILPDVSYMKATNEALMRFGNKLLNMPDWGTRAVAVKQAENSLIGKNLEFTKRMQAMGKSPQEIEEGLQVLNQRLGY